MILIIVLPALLSQSNSEVREMFSEFDKLCKEFENLDPVTYSEVLKQKSVKIIAVMSAITENGVSGVQIYTSFIISYCF